MKQVSTNTPGGRVRQVRMAKGMNLKEFADVIGMTPNHLGMAERGYKTTSDHLLRRVAEAMSVSLDWLRNGDDGGNNTAPSVSTETITEHDSSEGAAFAQIDARLFLSVIMAEDPEMNRKNLALILHTTEDTVDAVLCGKQSPAAYGWTVEFLTLARRLDMSATSHKLKALAAFLDKEEESAIYDRMRPLIQSLMDYTEATGVENLEFVHIYNEKTPVPYYRVKFQNNIGRPWEFCYIQDADTRCIRDMVDTILGNLLALISLSVVFDDKAAYETFNQMAADYRDNAEILNSPARVSAILIDGETYAVLDETICWPIDEQDSAK